MTNRIAVYKDEKTLEFVFNWFQLTYGGEASAEHGFITVRDLYQKYCEYTLPRKWLTYRMNPSEFAKCLVACKILDIGGRFVYRPSYEPVASAIARATA